MFLVIAMDSPTEPTTPETTADRSLAAVVSRRPGWRSETPWVAAVALVALVVTVVAPSATRWAGVLAVIAMVVGSVLERDSPTQSHRLPIAAGTAVLAITGVGLLDLSLPGTEWRPLVAVVAYPLLGRALLSQVVRYRLVREADVIVESVLIGAAASIILQVGIEWWSPTTRGPSLLTGSALASLLVGLDVALVVIVARSLATPEIRRGPVGVSGIGATALLCAHLVSAVRHAEGVPPGAAAELLAGGALLALGAASVLAGIRGSSTTSAIEPPLFSPGHAGVVVVSVLAAPVVVAVHVVRQISVSSSVAVGAMTSAVILAVHVVSLLRERADSEHQATHDSLTDLPNRLLFTDRLERAIAHAGRNGSSVGVLYVDLDRFKDVNDTLGHDAGDRLLEMTARRLQTCARYEDTVARLAGDEFALLLPHLAAADDVLIVAERVLEALGAPVDIGEHTLRNGGSVGVAVFPEDGTEPQDLLNAADAAMYRAKEGGGARVGVYSAELHRHASTRLEVESALVHAIERNELVLRYQPIIDAATGTIDGAEALVRWEHPERGLIGPDEFIPVAEQSDLIVRLGEWVIREACHELARWEQLGCGGRSIAVNVSARHFHADLVSTVTAALRESGADPRLFMVELTESAAVDDVELVADRLRELRQIGVRAAIDDFGTGYCGLQYLGDLPVSALKLDRSFVQAMTPRSAAIVAATIAMADSLGLVLIAEGVETAEQQRFLTRQGCPRLQGYHLGRPMPADDLVDRMRAEGLPASASAVSVPVPLPVALTLPVAEMAAPGEATEKIADEPVEEPVEEPCTAGASSLRFGSVDDLNRIGSTLR